MSLGIRQALTQAQQQRFQGRGNVRDNAINGLSKAAGMLKGGGVGGWLVEKGVKLALKSGLADAITGGKATKFLTGLYNIFHPNVGVKSEYAKNVAEASGYIGQGTKSIVNVLNKNV